MNWCRRGWQNAIWTSVTDVGSSKECLQRKCFSSFVKTCRFSSLSDEKRKKRRLMKWEKKNDRSDAMFRRIDPVPSFFSFSVKSFTSSWLHRRLMVLKFSNFCIVFFIFQWVQSLGGSRRVEWLHVDGCLSKIKLELVIDNPILLRWDIKYVFPSLKWKWRLTFFLSIFKVASFIRKLRFSVVLFCGWKSLKMLFFFFCLIVGMICSGRV